MTVSTRTKSRHTEATRQAILAAGSDLLLERRDGFTVQDVADRAGLTHRTVYRYFPTRHELLAATARSVAFVAGDTFQNISTVDEWLDALEPHFARIEADLVLVQRLFAAVLSSEDLREDDTTRQRDAHRWEVFRTEFPHLAEREARRAFVTLRHLTSSTSYLLYRRRFELPPVEAAETIHSAAVQIVELARAGDRAATAGGRRDD